MHNDHPFATWGLCGHERVLELLERAYVRGKLAHAIILSGPAHIGKYTVAVQLARALVCTNEKNPARPCEQCAMCVSSKNNVHPDITHVSRQDDKKEITVDQVRALRSSLEHTSLFEGYRVAIIEDADALTDEGANALLKILEEPRGKTVFLLITTNTHRMLRTIQSRCVTIALSPEEQHVIQSFLVKRGVDRSHAEMIAALARGKIGTALDLAHDEEKLLAVKETHEQMLALLEDASWTARRKRIETVADQWVQANAVAMMSTMLHTILRLSISAVEDKTTHTDHRFIAIARRGRSEQWSQSISFLNTVAYTIQTTNVQPLFAYEQFLLSLP
ncbi:DNA polymerase III subunit delta' [Candidatus Uhrbacteria bacterium]|nr:DNA polymerase III subunit delta' [Candidatus Uhrbacteria bacterium]